MRAGNASISLNVNGWTSRRLRFDSVTNPKKSQVALTPEAEVSFVPMDAVGEFGGLNLEEVWPLDEIYDGYTYFANGDICIAKITPCFENGKGALASGLKNGVGFGTTELHIVRTAEELSPRFFFYVSISHVFRSLGMAEMIGAGGQKRVPEDFIKDWKLTRPSLPQQERIADFLDERTARVDGLIAKKEQLLELLSEKRQAFITRAITKGLDLDAPMKPRGIDWLGDIPRHADLVCDGEMYRMMSTEYLVSKHHPLLPDGWKTRKLKFVAKIRTSNVDKVRSDEETPVSLCNYTDVYYNDTITPDLTFMQGSATESEIKRFELRRDQVILTKDSESWDDIAIPSYVPEDMPGVVCGYHLAVLTTDQEQLSGRYLSWLCRTEGLNGQFKVSANGVTRYGLGHHAIKNALVSFSSVAAQERIADYVAQGVSEIDKVVTKVGCSIERLREYRSALITAAVTGQLEIKVV